jgi:hypothetical protein
MKWRTPITGDTTTPGVATTTAPTAIAPAITGFSFANSTEPVANPVEKDPIQLGAIEQKITRNDGIILVMFDWKCWKEKLMIMQTVDNGSSWNRSWWAVLH